MSVLSRLLVLVGLASLLHAAYSAHEFSVLSTEQHKTAPLPVDIKLEAVVSVLVASVGLVLGADPLKPISWSTWAGQIEREGGPSPFAALEERPGFVDIRAKRKEFADWNGRVGQANPNKTEELLLIEEWNSRPDNPNRTEELLQIEERNSRPDNPNKTEELLQIIRPCVELLSTELWLRERERSRISELYLSYAFQFQKYEKYPLLTTVLATNMSAAISAEAWATPYPQIADSSVYGGPSTITAASSLPYAPSSRPASQYVASGSLPSLATSVRPSSAAASSRRKRASHPKIRRIKCDESKPSCSVQEKRVFHRFQLRTVPVFSGGSETGFWQSLVLQVGQQEEVVRNAIIALASLHEDYQIRSGRYEAGALLQDDSYRSVTLLYSKALRQLNRQLDEPSAANAKLAIICSILFACFEVLRRNNMAAVIHYQQGMRELMRQMNLPEVGDMASASNEAGPVYKVRTIPQNELDQLLRVFCRYDIQACTFSKDRAERVSAEVPTEFPAHFTLTQVRNHLDTLLICVYQMAKSDLQMFRYWNKDDIPIYWQQRKQDAVTQFQNWLDAIEGFFRQPGLALSQHDSKSLLGLRLQIRVALIMVRISIDCKPETTYDQFTSEFEEIVSRSEQLFQSLALQDAKPLDVENANEFTMELGLVHPLFFVATKCRDWTLRRRAVAQLRKAGKEGVWEGPVMAVLATKIMKLEEEGVTQGALVPERNRFHEIKKNVDYDGRQILFEAHKPLDETYQNWHIHRDAVAF
ncbi:hypothetical protein DV735_g1885, partial [Chaetothyriales sp. CBS 134920]